MSADRARHVLGWPDWAGTSAIMWDWIVVETSPSGEAVVGGAQTREEALKAAKRRWLARGMPVEVRPR